MQVECGKVATLWRYPVKSLLGEKVVELSINDRGVAGDRIFAIQNVFGKLASGKSTKKLCRMDGLFSMSAFTENKGVSILFPDGEVLAVNDEGLNAKLTQMLGQEVRIAKETDVSHFDDSPVHILTAAAVNSLARELPDSGIDARRFRPNMVIDTKLKDQEFLGRNLSIGNAVLEVTHSTERCRMITLDQAALEYRSEILKAVARDHDLAFGVYASVKKQGTIHVGDSVTLSS